jgi:autotransporter passenger strand-loop-strand repeat protein
MSMQIVSSGAVSSGIVVTSGNALLVFSGGTASATTVSSGGTEQVLAGGSGFGDTVSNGGALGVFGTESSATISSGGLVAIAPGGVASATTVLNGGTFVVQSGGVASRTAVRSGGTEQVQAGGSGFGETVNNGGALGIFGTESSATISNGGLVAITSGGMAGATTVSNGGTLVVQSGGVASGTAVSSGGTEMVQAGGSGVGDTVSSSGALGVFGTESRATISSGGLVAVAPGGVASTTTVSNGGTLVVQSGGVPRIAIVEGDDVRSLLTTDQLAEREVGGAVLRGATEVIAANLYLGAGPIAEALDRGADIVVTGRVADSALALGPLMHAFGWRSDDWARLAAGTLVGHLLECGSQVTGGYFADPPLKDVPGLAEVGYPIAEVDAEGAVVITKPDGTGGRVDRLTVIEQLLYEVHDPSAYLAPDVVLDLTQVSVEEIARDRVRIVGARGKPAPETLKATVCIDGGVLGEAEISYAGRNAGMRARLAAQIIRDRMQARAPDLPIRIDAIGVSSVLDHDQLGLDRAWPAQATDVRLRFAAQGRDAAHVMLLLDEVEALYCAGPAGGAGVRRSITPRLASASCLIERSFARPRVTMFESRA